MNRSLGELRLTPNNTGRDGKKYLADVRWLQVPNVISEGLVSFFAGGAAVSLRIDECLEVRASSKQLCWHVN